VPIADDGIRTARPSRDGVVALRSTHAALGLDIDASTAFPRWDGEPVDRHLAVQTLLAAGDSA
jgi:hypothetical protein